MRTMTPALLAAALLMAGCASTSTPGTPSAPTPPQVTVANAVKDLSDFVDAGAHACAAAYSNGTMSATDFNGCKSALTALANYGTAVNAELSSTTDTTWPQQKAAIISITTNAALTQVKAAVSPNVALLIATAYTAAQAISTAAGGPQL